jgi:uncharacterized protein (UPF0332 family)
MLLSLAPIMQCSMRQALYLPARISLAANTPVCTRPSESTLKTGLIEDEYAKMLGQAFDSRLDSDYDVAFTAGRTLAEEVSRDAQRFVDRVEQFFRQVGAI